MNARNRLIIILSVIAGLFLIAGGVLLNQRDNDGVYVRSSGQAAIGGPFELIRHDGKTVTDKDFLGRHMLVFFGFTYCPDVCPTELAKIADVMDILGDDAANLDPVFISVDPGRDTPEMMHDYVSAFHDRMIGLTGNQEQINAVAKAYKVYHKKVITDPEHPEDYSMDHSSVLYLMGPDGKFMAPLMPDTLPENMAAMLRNYI